MSEQDEKEWLVPMIAGENLLGYYNCFDGTEEKLKEPVWAGAPMDSFPEDEDYVPEIKDIAELKERLKPLYIINDHMQSPEEYAMFYGYIYDIVKGCFEKKECREYPVKFKFYVKDKETHTLELRHFLVNLLLWIPFTELYGIPVLDKELINDCNEGCTYKGLLSYLDDKLISTLIEYNLKYTTMSKRVAESLHLLRKISLDFSQILNINLTLESIQSMYAKNDRLKEIMTTTFDDDTQPKDIEDALSALQKEEIAIYKQEPNNTIGIILRAGSGMKEKQLVEFTVNMGLKPDISGKTIPVPINGNTLIGGLNKPSSLFIDANGASKSLVLNKKVMGSNAHVYEIAGMSRCDSLGLVA